MSTNPTTIDVDTYEAFDMKMKMSRSEPDLMKLAAEVPASDTTAATTTSTLIDAEESMDMEAPPMPSPSPMTEKKRTVSFGNLEALSFPVVKGDPNFEMAYPMTLGWECLDESTLTIDDYEANRKPRRTQDELRTVSEERRKIIKDSKKQRKHRRRESIGNGQIGKDTRRNVVQDFLIASATAITKSTSNNKTREEEKQLDDEQQPRRGTLRRQNSIGNGEISRLAGTRRTSLNRVQEFIIASTTAITKSATAASTSSSSNNNNSKRDVNSTTTTPPAPRRGMLRRQNSIGNGQISRDKRRNGVQDFLKKKMSFGNKQ